ncbi:ABC transporter permease [Clostridiaceae bacterium M8S5]|nr:ABC transporter permease [Clostridiaceae bacterium M8S5]
MTTLIKNNLKLFLKVKYLAIGVLFFFALVNFRLLEALEKLDIHKDVIYYLKQSQSLSIFYFIFFVFITYEFLIKSRRNNIVECFSALHNGKLKVYLSKITVLVAFVVFMTIIPVLYNIIACITNNMHYKPYIYHIFSNIFLNIFLVSILAICLSTFISLYLNKFSAYLTMILLTVLISPIFDSIPYILFMGFEFNIYPFRELFDILPPNLDWSADKLYGLSIEAYRWNITLFWIGLLSALALFKLNNNKIKRIKYVSIVLILFSLINLKFFAEPSCIVNKDYNPKNYTAYDELYYLKDVQKNEKSGFSISSYDMELIIKKQLSNRVIMSLDEEVALKSYKFTLYRNYKIEKILDKSKNELEFKRQGDYIEIHNPTDKKLEEIEFIYSGNSPVFYSNYQGVLLPGCFPYYPIEGYKVVYSKDEGSFIPIIRDRDAQFKVSIESNLDIYSNLKREENNKFIGNSQAISLVGGFVSEEKVGDITYYSLILEKLDTANLSNIEMILRKYKRESTNNNNFNISDKKVFQVPDPMHYRILNNGLVSFRDHVFVFGLDKEILAYSFLKSDIPSDIKKVELKTALFDYILYKNRILKVPKKQLENNEDLKVLNLFLEKIEQFGEEFVLKSTYDFLIDKNDNSTSLMFIENLKAGGK